MKLTVAEELILILLDDEKGTLPAIPQLTLHIIVAGAALMDLAARGKVDNDAESVFVCDKSPTGIDYLDQVLTKIVGQDKERNVRFWINTIADDGAMIIDSSFDLLVERAILGVSQRKYLWIMKSRCYPTLDGTFERDVKRRIMNIVYSDDIPQSKDIVLIALLDAGDIFRTLLGTKEYNQVRDRVQQISKLELIGQSTTKLIHDIQVALVATHAPLF